MPLFTRLFSCLKILGPEKFYPRVQAPAVCLRLDIACYKQRMKEAYSDFQPECNLYNFLFEYHAAPARDNKWMIELNECKRIDVHIAYYFLKKTNFPLTPAQMSMFERSLQVSH